MANSYTHAVSSARRYGGRPESYQPIHDWFDETKAHFASWQHRALRHHSHGIFLCEERFGKAIDVPLEDGRVKQVPVRIIAEQHVIEDCGFIPTVQDWLEHLQPTTPEASKWMLAGAQKLSRVLERSAGTERLRDVPTTTSTE